MNKKNLGIACIIFGSLTLSLELFMLKMISYLDRLATNSWNLNTLEYIKEPIILYAMAIPTIMVLFGIVIYDTEKNNNKVGMK